MSGFSSILNGTLEQSQWVLQINHLIDQNALLPVSQTPISIFRLPESLQDGDPDAYLPSHVAFGPYHHFRLELYKMDIFKLGKAQNLKLGSDSEIHKLVDELTPLELRIRACFDQTLEMNGETLTWVVVIDGLFLIHLLQNKYMHNNRPLEFPLDIFYGKLWSEFEIISDIVKLENQIPLFVLNEICSKEQPMNFLAPFLYRFSTSVSSFQLPCFNPELECFGFSSYLPQIFNSSHHLLHFLYYLVLLIPDEKFHLLMSNRMGSERENSSSSSSEFLIECFNILGSVINMAFFQQLKDFITLIQRLFKLFGLITKTNLVERKPLLTIPSASDLKTVGITFKATKNGILKSFFDKKSLSLTLPCVHLDGFSQVLLKNLVAFEAMAELNPPCLVDYTDLMNGLLRNSKDLKILEEAEIVHNHLKTKEEAVKLFNAVECSTRCLKKEKVLKIHVKKGVNLETDGEFIQDVKMNYEMGLGSIVEEINNFYANCWRMKMKKFMSVVFKCLAILVVILLFLLVIVRFVCKVDTCFAAIFRSTIALHQKY